MMQARNWSTLALTFTLAAASAFAPTVAHAEKSGGGGVGNGGGSWTCRSDNSDHPLIWIRLVDLSEAEREFHETVPNSGNMTGPIAGPKEWLTAGNRFLTWAEGKINQANPQFYAEYLRRKADLINGNRIFVPAESDFDHTSDIRHHTKPDASSCMGGHVSDEPEQLANFTLMGHLEINGKLWSDPALSEIDRAALFVHEVIYWMFRDLAHDTDSLRTRVIVGYLFSSNKPVSEYASMMTLNPTLAGAPGLPIRYGMFGEIKGEWIDIQIDSYNTTTGELRLTQRDRDDRWRAKSQAQFMCTAQGSEYECHMTWNSRLRQVEWSSRYIRIIDPSNFVWVRLNRNGSVHNATHYSKLP